MSDEVKAPQDKMLFTFLMADSVFEFTDCSASREHSYGKYVMRERMHDGTLVWEESVGTKRLLTILERLSDGN